MTQMPSPQGFSKTFAPIQGSHLDFIPSLQRALFAPGTDSSSIFTQMSHLAEIEPISSVLDRLLSNLLACLVEDDLETELHLSEIESSILDLLDDSRVVYISDEDHGDAFFLPMEMFFDQEVVSEVEASGRDFWLVYRIDAQAGTSVSLRLATTKPRAEDDLPGSSH